MANHKFLTKLLDDPAILKGAVAATAGAGAVASADDADAGTPPWLRRLIMDQAAVRGPTTGSLVDKVARGAWYNGGSWYPEIGETFANFQTGKNITPKVGEPWGISLSAIPDISAGFAKAMEIPPPKEAAEEMMRARSAIKDLVVNSFNNKNFSKVGEELYMAGLGSVKHINTLSKGDDKYLNSVLSKIDGSENGDIAYLLKNLGLYDQFNSELLNTSLRQKYSSQISRVLPQFRSSPDVSVLPAWASPDNKAAMDTLNEAYVDAAHRVSQKNYKTQFAPVWDSELTSKFPLNELNDVYTQAKISVGSEYPFNERELAIIDAIAAKGEPNSVRVPMSPERLRNDPKHTESFNKELSNSLQDRGVDALLYSPHRWNEYEMRLLNPDNALVTDIIPVDKSSSVSSIHSLKRSNEPVNRYDLAQYGKDKFPRIQEWKNGAAENKHNLGDIYRENDFWSNPMKYGGKYLLGGAGLMGAAGYEASNPDSADAMFIGRRGMTNLFGRDVAGDLAWQFAKMKREGFTPEEIKKAINVHAGPVDGDRMLRYELSDPSQFGQESFDRALAAYKSRVDSDVSLGVEESVHPELFKAYPQLRDIGVDVDMLGGGAQFERGAKSRITLDKDTGPELGEKVAHEVQHATQNLEGFSRGASPEVFTTEGGRRYALENFNPRLLASLDKVNAISPSSREGYLPYYKTLGEVEARDVADRIGRVDTALPSSAYESNPMIVNNGTHVSRPWNLDKAFPGIHKWADEFYDRVNSNDARIAMEPSPKRLFQEKYGNTARNLGLATGLLGYAADDYINSKDANGMFIGPKGMSNFLGREAANSMIAQAEKMVASGKSNEEVRQALNLFKSMDDKWRYEIDDSGSALTKSRGAKYPVSADERTTMQRISGQYPGPAVNPLTKFITHDEFFNAYPELKRLNTRTHYIKPEDGIKLNAQGGLQIRRDGAPQEIYLNASDKNNMHGGLLHEMQHAVQQIEGFAPGGGTDIKNLKSNDPQLAAYRRNLNNYSSNPSYSKELADDLAKRQAYKDLAGEVEARNTSDRRLLSKEERLDIEPDTRRGAIVKNPDTLWEKNLNYIEDGAKTVGGYAGRLLDGTSKRLGAYVLNLPEKITRDPLGFLNDVTDWVPLAGTSKMAAESVNDPSATDADRINAAAALGLDMATLGTYGLGKKALWEVLK